MKHASPSFDVDVFREFHRTIEALGQSKPASVDGRRDAPQESEGPTGRKTFLMTLNLAPDHNEARNGELGLEQVKARKGVSATS